MHKIAVWPVEVDGSGPRTGVRSLSSSARVAGIALVGLERLLSGAPQLVARTSDAPPASYHREAARRAAVPIEDAKSSPDPPQPLQWQPAVLLRILLALPAK